MCQTGGHGVSPVSRGKTKWNFLETSFALSIVETAASQPKNSGRAAHATTAALAESKGGLFQPNVVFACVVLTIRTQGQGHCSTNKLHEGD